MTKNKKNNHKKADPAPITALLIHSDGELLVSGDDSLWFPPDFIYGHKMTELACSKDVAIGMSPADYVFENETIRGAGLKKLLDLISSEYLKFNEIHGKRGNIPKVFAGAANLKDFGALITESESWINTFVLIQNATELPTIKALIDDDKYYALSLEDDVLEY